CVRDGYGRGPDYW
nr:immunoglobulin heavy chain junction region [Macaca mulatta]